MKKALFLLFSIVLVIGFISTAGLSQDNTAKYIGEKKCNICHKSAKRGNQAEIWAKGPHAKAYTVLGTDEAKAVAKKAGVEGNPQESPKCLKCHVTAYSEPASVKEATLTMDEGVGCETCHGPGSIYKSLKIMKDMYAGTQDFAAVGALHPDENTCKKCHNPASPTYKEMNFAEAMKTIAHPVPKN